jgi:hypothetical protein
MPLNDKDHELLNAIKTKIESSRVLNGAFDKLCVTVDHIKDLQEEQTKKIDSIHERLYAPTSGLFSRIQQLENNFTTITKKIEEEDTHEEKQIVEIENIKKTAIDSQRVTKQLEKIGGEDLYHIKRGIDLYKKISKIYWALLVAILTSLANLIWQFVKTH